MWLRTKTNSNLDVLINFDHVTHVFANPYGSLVVLDNGEQNIGVKDTLGEISVGLEEARTRVWHSQR